MLGKISLIASIISALTAVTTSLRALGRSREYSGLEPHELQKKLSVFRLSIIIWYVLAVVFAVPFLAGKWTEQKYAGLFLWILLFLVLWFILRIIWRRVIK